MNNEDKTDTEQPIMLDQFLADVLTASARNTANASNAALKAQVISYYIERTTVERIRERIEALLDGPYMPMPSAIRWALYPNHEQIKEAAIVQAKLDYSFLWDRHGDI